jgi:hypothetical protein
MPKCHLGTRPGRPTLNLGLAQANREASRELNDASSAGETWFASMGKLKAIPQEWQCGQSGSLELGRFAMRWLFGCGGSAGGLQLA